MNFSSGRELLDLCNNSNKKISEIMMEKEKKTSELTEKEIIDKVAISLDIMKEATNKGLTEDIKSVSGLIGGDAKKVKERSERHQPVCGMMMSKAISRSMAVLEVNAAMGKIVAAPTAGSSGILPATLLTIGEEFHLSDERLIEGLMTASAIGMIISRNATVAGAEGGCQAETGSAAAMAAAAVVELMGGSPEASFHAAAICIKNILGLVCDPIAGLVESPCEARNAIGAANALISAEMALAGVKSLIPFDEVVDAMYRVGRCLPMELRETALGGLAATPTGKKLHEQVFGMK
ncbi:L-serine ammonia-lyase, iron-sulfur-dependent, subunit alpha [Clostridium formicaceticum]|uniref:L-serine dehydratase n=1 Tax=Clostridium formicaceticum TaxID=1497 RepID=A0AAC9WFZ6_9CLOT|nr:L-serine ammonia-lyase, iron-sulfur-dependent, subunit alpha [Clostridium formicaceticum]AOY76878.1 L-serine dehydratase, iron-sulfur-dependent subunit alpha [Clostridium formicaceticum]ARE87358.1 L-serine dehydratase, alpha chain [Clostridium formicaceticum]